MRHTIPLLHAAWAKAGLFNPKELLEPRIFESDLEAYPTPLPSFVDRDMGSPGQGLSVGVGIIVNNKHLDKPSARTYAVLGDAVGLTQVGIRQIPHREKPNQLLDHDEIRARGIAEQSKQLV